MHLDVANPSSYSGSGSTISNLVGNNSATLGGNYSFSNEGIRLFNSLTYGFNSFINLPLISNVRTISLWFRYDGTGFGGLTNWFTPGTAGYLIDTRPGFDEGYVYPAGVGSDWTTIYVNGGPPITKTWANINPPAGVWRNVTLIASYSFTGYITLFNGYPKNVGHGATFAVALVYSGVLTQEQNTANFNALKSRFGL